MLVFVWERWVVRSERRVLVVGIDWGGVVEWDLWGLGSGMLRIEYKRLYICWVLLVILFVVCIFFFVFMFYWGFCDVRMLIWCVVLFWVWVSLDLVDRIFFLVSVYGEVIDVRVVEVVEWRGLKRSFLEGNLKVFKFGKDSWVWGGMVFYNLCGMVGLSEYLLGYMGDVFYFGWGKCLYYVGYLIWYFIIFFFV